MNTLYSSHRGFDFANRDFNRANFFSDVILLFSIGFLLNFGISRIRKVEFREDSISQISLTHEINSSQKLILTKISPKS